MALDKQAIDISFGQGLDTKSDPKRVKMGNFVKLENSVFNKGGLLQKRNGYRKLTSLPSDTYSFLTTFNGDLTAVGDDIAALNPANASWVQKGKMQPCSLKTLPLIHNNLNQTALDTAVASNGLVCTVYIESDGSNLVNKYAIADSVTGQNIIAPAVIPVSSGTVSGGMRVFVLGNNFIIVFTNTITGTPHLQYVSISTSNPSNVSANADLAASYITATTLSWDAFVANDVLYYAYNTTAGGQAIEVNYMTRTFIIGTATNFAGEIATMVSVTADTSDITNIIIYVSYWDDASNDGWTLAVDTQLVQILAPTQIINNKDLLNITSIADDGICYVAYEVSNTYSFTPGTGTPTNYIETLNVTEAGVVSTPYIMIRSLGLGSKPFVINGVFYLLGAYQSSYQNTYFLINATESTEDIPVIVAKLAYSNGGGYYTKGLPSVSVYDETAYVGYRYKTLVQSVNKETDVETGTQVVGVYAQTGLNLCSFTLNSDELDAQEIGANLNIGGGYLWAYDGYLPVEQSFFLWPDIGPSSPPNPVNSSAAAWSATGGSIKAQPDGATNTNAYFYQVTYEWSDNQGNLFRSSPSIPIAVTTTGNGSSGSIVVKVPTLRVTAKVANPIKIVIYRWSVAQPAYYQVTSISSPTLNDTSADSISFTDTLADASILGNNLLYTTGGVVENVSPPATDIVSLFDTRFWQVDSENRNLLWFSKQVIQSTPVEMSDLFTKYIPPTVATATGDITSLFPMDDKLIIGKGGNSFVYINGSGPDNTGANNQYSEPIFITSTVGCSNQRSIVLIPQGAMFQSNKGIWLLGRDLSTSYIGAPVEEFTLGAVVNSAVSVPETNQVRFTLDSGITLMYDYYYGQWSTFTGVPAVSSCIYNGMHSFINRFAGTYQEEENYYLDGSNPVLMNFKTGPLRLGDLQGYQRAYYFYVLGQFISPHKLQMNMYFDYENNPSQSVIITPDNYSTPYGSGSSQSPYGQGNPYGGGSTLENWQVFLDRQRCMAFAIEMREIFDRSYDTVAGAGLTVSGLNLVMGFKKGFRPLGQRYSVG